MLRFRWRRSLCALLISFLASAALAEQETASLQSLFAKMSRVSHSLNYQGSFTYEYQNSPSLQSFRVSHWVEDGVEYERLQYLNGPEREIIRHGQQLDCLTPGDQLLQGRLTQIGSRLVALDEIYQFQVLHAERVAGRLVSMLQVMPRDAFRHGYVLGVDQETGLVLMSLMVDTNGRVLERYQFIELELDPDVQLLANAPAARRQREATTVLTDCNKTETLGPQGWRLRWLPQGFAFAGQQRQQERDMLTYTDGLTTFSVFIEPSNQQPPEGVGQRGPTLAYMSKLVHGQVQYRITVVGEIPALAAEQIAQGIVASAPAPIPATNP